MANFMGPMAPPQAAQPQPQTLDVRTNPAQRAQFKNFMTSMSAPVMPTTAPVAPMLAAPSPMDQIDIFNPVQAMAVGGMVDGGRERGRGDFRDPMQNNFSQVPAGPNLGEGGQEMFTDKALAKRMFDDSTSLSEVFDINKYLGSSSPLFDRQSFSLDVPPVVTDTVSEFTPQPLINSPAGTGISAVATVNDPFGFGGVLSGGPTMTEGGGFGIMANYAIPFRRGGTTFEVGESYETGRGIGEQVRERQARGRADYQGGNQSDAERSDARALELLRQGGGGDGSDSITAQGINIEQAPVMDALSEIIKEQRTKDFQADARNAMAESKASQASTEFDLNMMGFQPELASNFVPTFNDSSIAAIENVAADNNVANNLLAGLLSPAFNDIRKQKGQLRTVDEAEFFRDDERRAFDAVANPSLPFNDPRYSGLSVFDQVYSSTASNPNQSFAGADGPDPAPRPSLFSDESVMRQIMDDDTVNRERPTDLKSLFGEDSETYKNIMERSTPFESETFPTAAGILGKVMGGANINNIINKINEGGTPILDNDGNIQGVLHDGLFGGTVYSGNEGFNPMAGPKPEREDNQPLPLPITSTTPESETPLTVAPPMVDPTSPAIPPSPTDVIVPSTRTNVPVTVPVVTPAPIESVLPQSLLDLLQARQPVRSFADGGAVLDDAAGRFLEALTAA